MYFVEQFGQQGYLKGHGGLVTRRILLGFVGLHAVVDHHGVLLVDMATLFMAMLLFNSSLATPVETMPAWERALS